VTILRQQATKRKLLPSFGNITGFVINPRPSDHSMTLPAGLPLRSPAAEISIGIRHQHRSSAANKSTGNREFPENSRFSTPEISGGNSRGIFRDW